jgi:hypothetical protein
MVGRPVGWAEGRLRDTRRLQHGKRDAALDAIKKHLAGIEVEFLLFRAFLHLFSVLDKRNVEASCSFCVEIIF